MSDPALQEHVAALRRIYDGQPDTAEAAMEDYLYTELLRLAPSERLAVLSRLEREFSPEAGTGSALPDADGLRRLLPLLLGRDIATAQLPPEELFQRLAGALNTIFTTLNELIRVINATLGGTPEGDATIRHIIGGSLESPAEKHTIEEYLGQIRTAFLTAQQASQEAARTIAGYILTELDPKTMSSGGGGLKLGAFKKSDAFESFEEKYARVRKWFDSERFLHDFLRQFENQCRKKMSGE